VTSIQAGSAVVITPNQPVTTTTTGGDGGNTGAIVGGVVGGVLGFAVFVVCVVLVVLLIVFLIKKGNFLKFSGKKWKQQNWWEEDDL